MLRTRLFGDDSTPVAGPDTMLSIRGVRLAYGESVVIRDLSLDLPAGKIVCLMGRNGAGKTTLLNGLIGNLRIRAGSITLLGQEIGRRQPDERARLGIGYVPQGRGIFPYLSVMENLLIGLEPLQGKDTGQLEEMFTLFPILRQMRRRTAGVLSGGQQQQLAIARALLSKPQLLLLDEPTEGIQPSIVEEIEQVIFGLRGRMTVLLVEQFLDFALNVGDYCYVMEAGAIVLQGEPGGLDPVTLREYLAL